MAKVREIQVCGLRIILKVPAENTSYVLRATLTEKN